ncbi:vegetative incompatibility protein HET-E-1 [Lingula anatina]|uniref:Vegetative incompatibility protein HET-E-1 n=1 Tax=Lingula anatina TaxID=7574 RepID=A0A1S3I933_LINAN|nr:vegetative incompatibility protein HET-E-1 [Lingula anatina]|eukprot:XP_013394376.1 vegetative incompatibility protein HET-E-1 [Lingula anatina]
MSRRRLEAAIQAGKQIEQGTQWPSNLEKVDNIKQVSMRDIERDGIYSLQFSYDGNTLAVGYGNSGIEILDALTGNPVQELRKSKYGGLPIGCLRFNPQQQHILFAGGADGNVYSCNSQTGECTEIISEKHNEINCLDFSMDSFSFATAGKDLDIRIYDTKTQELVTEYKGYHQYKPNPEEQGVGHAQRIFALKFHPENDNIFITGGWDNHLKVWDKRSSDGVKRTIGGPHICGDGLDVRGFQILTGSWTHHNALQIFDYSTGKLQQNIPFPDNGEGQYLYCAQFCENDVVIAGGSGTKSAKAINITTGECLGEVKMSKAVQAMDSTKGGRLFAIGGGDTYLKIAGLA